MKTKLRYKVYTAPLLSNKKKFVYSTNDIKEVWEFIENHEKENEDIWFEDTKEEES